MLTDSETPRNWFSHRALYSWGDQIQAREIISLGNTCSRNIVTFWGQCTWIWSRDPPCHPPPDTSPSYQSWSKSTHQSQLPAQGPSHQDHWCRPIALSSCLLSQRLLSHWPQFHFYSPNYWLQSILVNSSFIRPGAELLHIITGQQRTLSRSIDVVGSNNAGSLCAPPSWSPKQPGYRSATRWLHAISWSYLCRYIVVCQLTYWSTTDLVGLSSRIFLIKTFRFLNL